MRFKSFGLFWLVCLFFVSGAFADEGPQVEIFTPQGTMKGIREVSVRFSEQMVPFGDPRGLIEPFEIVCSEKGESRWVDGKNWVYDFGRDLPAGIRCEFRLKPGSRALSGKELTGQREFSFSTGGPAVLKNSYPREGQQNIDEEQVFILALDGEPDVGSVTQNVFFSVAGIQDHIGIRVIEGKEREEILKTRHMKGATAPLLLIQSRQRFPASTPVSLVWGKGVKSKTGVATEQDQVLRFVTRKPFLVEFHCQRENPRAGCIPILPMNLHFSAPISRDQATHILLKGADGKVRRPKFGDSGEMDFVTQVTFHGPFPEDTDFKIELPVNLRDDARRPLVNADQFPLSVRTDRYPPLAKFSARFGILESKADPMLPVTLRNLEPEVKARMKRADQEEGIIGRVTGKILNVQPEKGYNVQAWLRKVASATRESSIFGQEKGVQEFIVPKPGGGHAFEVVGIPLKDPGFYIVELESAILGKALLDPPKPMFVPTAALVTNLSVHFKWGFTSSLVWVTALDTGEPVKDAEVSVRDCREEVLWRGKTDDSGLARIEGRLPSADSLPRCDYPDGGFDYSETRALRDLGGGLFILARTSDDMAFVHSSWDDGIEPWRFQLPELPFSTETLMGHTLFDRMLFRAGETVHMKHIFREQAVKGFLIPHQIVMPQIISIQHEGSGERHTFPVKWDGQGIAESTWTIPKEAKLGNYGVRFLTKDPKTGYEREWVTGEFRVEEFRVPLLKGAIQAPTEPLINAKEVPLDLSVHYLAGGGAGLLPVKLRNEIRPKSVRAFEGFDHFVFGNGAVTEGLVRRGEPLDFEEGEERRTDQREMKLPSCDLVLDQFGSARTTVSGLPKIDVPKEMVTELEFRDPNGEIQTVSRRTPLWPSKYLIGIRSDAWAVSKDALRFHVAVLDLSGNPISSAWVRVDLYERKTYTHRKRLVGGFYAYEHSAETRRVATLCEGKSDAKGLLICEVKSPVSGNVILQAQTSDDAGNEIAVHQDVWVAGKSDWWFEVGDHDRMDLIPEKRRYEPGETAIFQVRMPFRSALALVTVEREGVIEAWVKRISGKNPVIEVPIKGSYAPNVFVSALVLRGRLPGIRPSALVDLGKPAYRLGIAEVNVGWGAHELKVSVSTDRKIYKVRQKARVRIKVTKSDGQLPPPRSEIALAAVDEGLLELMANRSWEILPAMMKRRGCAVRTATAQMQVIGKRHFGLKALPQGGGGGRQITRELFDTLLFWKGRLSLDENGEASVEVPLNDSITSFRIVAVATGGAGLFGTGSTSIQSSQDLVVLSGLPPLIREGDRFRAGFTVRNTTPRSMEVEVSGSVTGMPDSLKPLDLSLQPGEAKEVGWEVSAPIGLEKLQWELRVKEKVTGEADRLRVTQRVVPSVPLRTVQASIVQMEKDWRIDVERPKDALPGQGGVRVTLRPKIAEALHGVIDYMKRYPYTCMEQKISVAVALRDEDLWKKWMRDLSSHLDSDGLVKYFPPAVHGSPTLTSYILAIGDEAGWSIPDETREKMEAGLKKFISGTISRGSPIPSADLSMRKLSAIEALSRGGKADVKLLNSVAIEPNLWPTSAVIDWLNILQRMRTIPNREEEMKEAERIIRSRLNFQGTVMGFSTERTDCLWWLMVSNDVNAVRLILSLLSLDQWKEEMPRLVQGALARQKKGVWDLTLANAWGVLALEKFSKAYETVPVSGRTQASLLANSYITDWKVSPKGKSTLFAWPAKGETLSVSHQGAGRPWVSLQSLAAIPLKEPFSSGYKIKKTVTPIEKRQPYRWSRGDLLRIRLEIEAQADQTWVVVSDPVPAGTSILGKGLSRDSEILTRDEVDKGSVWPAFEERSFEAFRAYYEYVPKGSWTVEYTIRLNQAGVFQLPTTRVEALYFPEMFGEIPNQAVEVHP